VCVVRLCRGLTSADNARGFYAIILCVVKLVMLTEMTARPDADDKHA
jgi:hypothetical protein